MRVRLRFNFRYRESLFLFLKENKSGDIFCRLRAKNTYLPTSEISILQNSIRTMLYPFSIIFQKYFFLFFRTFFFLSVFIVRACLYVQTIYLLFFTSVIKCLLKVFNYFVGCCHVLVY